MGHSPTPQMLIGSGGVFPPLEVSPNDGVEEGLTPSFRPNI